MKFWQMLVWSETDQYTEIAKSAEENDFFGVMNADHAFFPKTMQSNYPYSEDGSAPMGDDRDYPDPWVTLAHMAAVTNKLRLSTAVYILPLRNPIEVAKATGTLAILSNNRFMLGAGIGWMQEEYEGYGLDFKLRGKRYDECLDVIELLWSGQWSKYQGQYIQFKELRILPAPEKRIPILMGGSSDAALKRMAKRADGFIGVGNHPDEIPDLLNKLNIYRKNAGRLNQPFETILGLTVEHNLDTLKRLYDIGVTSTVNPPFAFSIGWESTIQQKIDQMKRYAEEIIRPMHEYAKGNNN
tara:strand:+ start:17304 stop:18197 length:894 start_codon:yes stop_codon:yes gene_type:complete